MGRRGSGGRGKSAVSYLGENKISVKSAVPLSPSTYLMTMTISYSTKNAPCRSDDRQIPPVPLLGVLPPLKGSELDGFLCCSKWLRSPWGASEAAWHCPGQPALGGLSRGWSRWPQRSLPASSGLEVSKSGWRLWLVVVAQPQPLTTTTLGRWGSETRQHLERKRG